MIFIFILLPYAILRESPIKVQELKNSIFS